MHKNNNREKYKEIQIWIHKTNYREKYKEIQIQILKANQKEQYKHKKSVMDTHKKTERQAYNK